MNLPSATSFYPPVDFAPRPALYAGQPAVDDGSGRFELVEIHVHDHGREFVNGEDLKEQALWWPEVTANRRWHGSAARNRKV